MSYKIKNVISSQNIPAWGNQKKYIAIHYLGVDGQGTYIGADGCGAHYYIYWDGTIYQRCSHDAVPWAVGTAGYYTKKHSDANNYNTISIEMCVHADGNPRQADDKWWFTEETQEACVWLVKKLMKELNIPEKNVLRHYDIVNKVCPAPYVYNNKYRTSWTWSEFKAKISDNSSNTATSPSVSTSGSTNTSSAKLFRIRKTWKNEKSQIGAYKNKKNAIENCPTGYKVFNSDGKVVYNPKKADKTASKVEYATHFVKSISGTYKTKRNLNLRKGAGTGNSVLCVIPKGDKLTCYGYYSMVNKVKWYYVVYGDYKGFVSSKYIKKITG